MTAPATSPISASISEPSIRTSPPFSFRDVDALKIFPIDDAEVVCHGMAFLEGGS